MDATERSQALYAKFLNFSPSRGDQRRIKILEKTIELLGSKLGVEGTSFESIGKELDMVRAHVAYYYPDRDALVEAAIKLVIATVQSYTVDYVKEASNDGMARLEAFINGTFAWVKEFPHQTRVILLLYYYSSFNRRYRKLHDEVRSLGAQRITAVVSEIMPTKKRRAAYQVAKFVQSILTGHIVDYLTTEPDTELDSLRRKTIKEVKAYLEFVSA